MIIRTITMTLDTPGEVHTFQKAFASLRLFKPELIFIGENDEVIAQGKIISCVVECAEHNLVSLDVDLSIPLMGGTS